MNLDALREFCLSFPHATEDIQWEHDLLFRIGGKIFAGVGLEDPSHTLCFKCTPEEFAELTERDGIVPAPYVARYHWVQLQHPDALSTREIKRLITDSHAMVLGKLPKKQRDALGGSPTTGPKPRRATGRKRATD